MIRDLIEKHNVKCHVVRHGTSDIYRVCKRMRKEKRMTDQEFVLITGTLKNIEKALKRSWLNRLLCSIFEQRD